MGKVPEPTGPAVSKVAAVDRPPRPRTRSRARLQVPTVGPDGRPAAMHYAAGDIIADKYQLTSVIGEGGMGSVWLARNIVLHVDVALKVVNREVASKEATQRLIVEARAAARLTHPSIVRIHDFGKSTRGDPFIVMELLKGESLADVLERKDCLPAVNAVQLLLPIVSALGMAHAEGIVHRDLKPENIILVADHAGSIIPKLVDFGVAKVAPERFVSQQDFKDFSKASEDSKTADVKRRLTMLGSIVGSPDYLSPEQARGELEIDERADLWSIAILLYETICGVRPFDGETIDKLLISILFHEPQPSVEHGAGDAALWEIIRRGLAKHRRERWQNAQAMGEALATWLVAQGVTTDITGSSVQQQWLRAGVNRPFSMAPPSLGGADAVSSATGAVRIVGAGSPAALGSSRGRTAERLASDAAVATRLEPGRRGRQRRALVGGTVAAAVLLPLLLFTLSTGGPEETAQDAAPTGEGDTAASSAGADDGASSAAPAVEDAGASPAPDASESSTPTAAPKAKKKGRKGTKPSTEPTTAPPPEPLPAGPDGMPIPDRANF